MDTSLNRSFKLFPEGSIFRSQQSKSNPDCDDNEHGRLATETPSAAKKAKLQVKRLNSVTRKLFNTSSKSKKSFLPPFKSQESSNNKSADKPVENIIPDPPSQNLTQLFGSCTVTQRTPLIQIQNNEDLEDEVPFKNSDKISALSVDKELNKEPFSEPKSIELPKQSFPNIPKQNIKKASEKKAVHRKKVKVQNCNKLDKTIGECNTKNKNNKKKKIPLFHDKKEVVPSKKALLIETEEKNTNENVVGFDNRVFDEFEVPAPISNLKQHQSSINSSVEPSLEPINNVKHLDPEESMQLEEDRISTIQSEERSPLKQKLNTLDHTINTMNEVPSTDLPLNSNNKNNSMIEHPNIKAHEKILRIPDRSNSSISTDLADNTNLSHVDNSFADLPLNNINKNNSMIEHPNIKAHEKILRIPDRSNSSISTDLADNTNLSHVDNSFADIPLNNINKNNSMIEHPNIKAHKIPDRSNTSITTDLDGYANLSHVDNPLIWETPKRKVSTSLLNIFNRSNQVCNSPVLFNDQHNTTLPARLDHQQNLFGDAHLINNEMSKTISFPLKEQPSKNNLGGYGTPQNRLEIDNMSKKITNGVMNNSKQNDPVSLQSQLDNNVQNNLLENDLQNDPDPFQNDPNPFRSEIDRNITNRLFEDHIPPSTPPNLTQDAHNPKWTFMKKHKNTNSFSLNTDIKEEVESPVVFTAPKKTHPQGSNKNPRGSDNNPVTPNSRSTFNDLKNVMLIWATHGNLITDLQRQSSEILVDENEIIPVYQFMVSIDILHLIDFHEELGGMALKNPLTFTHILKQVCFDVLRSEGMVVKLYSEYQLIIKPLLTSVPSLTENTITSPEDIRFMKQNPSGLFRIQGMVIGLSSCTPYTKSAKYTCAQTDCLWARENCYVISANVSTLDCDLIREDFPCNGCGNMLQEDIAWRKMSEKRYCFVTPKKAATNNLQVMHSSNYNIRCESIRIILKDELKDAVNIGSFYWFTGIFKHSITPVSASKQNVRVAFEVLTVSEDVPYTNPIKSYQRVLPDSLCSLYQDRRSSPWSFVSSLSYCFLDSISPPGTYYLFKTCLLLSLLMEGDRSVLNLEEKKRKYEVNNLHILVHNEDILPYQHMMLYACKFSESPVIHRVPMDLFGTITQDDQFTYVDGGSLALSSTSVCIIPNMLELKKKQMVQLQNVFDNQIISVHIPKKQHDEVQQNQFCIPFKGFVWTCNELQKGNVNTDFAIEDVSKMPPGLPSLFNLIFHEPANAYNQDIDASICDHILSNSLDVSTPVTSMFIHEHFDEYITHARKQEVTMSQEAFKLIKTFYLVSRRVNTSTAQISQTSFQTLLCLSAAHAKAMLHGIVLVNDAVAAIYLFEQLMTLCHGESTFGVLPVIHFLNSDISRHLGPENDERMYHLKRSVINYCATYYPDVSDLLNSD